MELDTQIRELKAAHEAAKAEVRRIRLELGTALATAHRLEQQIGRRKIALQRQIQAAIPQAQPKPKTQPGRMLYVPAFE
jgi:hypothetical protein